ncbi:MAG: T9SS type A sorting domain-containing protein [Bacteroidota bacterium]
MKNSTMIAVLLIISLCTPVLAQEAPKHLPGVAAKNANVAADARGFSHKIGALWAQVTNYGFYGDRNYEQPNFEWPGGSGNLYGWLQSIWIGGIVDTVGYMSSGEGNHFRPLDSIEVKHAAEGSLSGEDTYTRYTDVNPPSPSGIHMNLGVEVTERTYVWDQSYNDDFIICDYWIKYVLRDRNGDGIINAFDSTITGVYVAFRMDADVSGYLGTSTPTTLWDTDDLAGYNDSNKVMYLYDADSPNVAGNDTGNPDPTTGILRSPGYIGARLLYCDSAHFVGTYTGKPTMATPSYRNFEPLTTQTQYEFVAKGGIAPNATVIRDYRAIFGVGPYSINAGDSIHIVIAWVIGPGLNGILKNSQVAQAMFDGNYMSAPSSPNVPSFTINPITSGGAPALSIRWSRNAESSLDPLTGSQDFAGYGVYRTSRQDAGGNAIWDTLAIYVKNNAVDPVKDSIWYGRPFLKGWPPPLLVSGTDTLFEFQDLNTPNGLIYTYAVTSFDAGDSILGIGRLENQIGRGRLSTKVFMPNAPAATSTNAIRVVPNPFMGSSRLNNPNPVDTNPWINRIRFINLPPNATISIFTLAGDLVKTIHSGEIVYQSRDVAVTGDFSGVAEWDLATKNNQEAVSGLYIYVVESSAGTHTGKFVIMR